MDVGDTILNSIDSIMNQVYYLMSFQKTTNMTYNYDNLVNKTEQNITSFLDINNQIDENINNSNNQINKIDKYKKK